MTKGKSDKPAIFDGRKNGQSQMMRRINNINKSIEKDVDKQNKQLQNINKSIEKDVKKQDKQLKKMFPPF